MVLNYHEMTMGQPRDSPQTRKQFLIICTVIAGCFLNAAMTAGSFTPLEVKEGIFPGGTFIYRYSSRDYAGSAGLREHVGKDLNITYGDFQDFVYSLYLDDPSKVTAKRQRFATGILVDEEQMKESGSKLLDMNPEIEKKAAITPKKTLEPWERFKLQPYLSVSLPSVDAAVVQFPFTNGFVSALVQSYKVIPKLREYVKEKGEEGNFPLVISTCSPKQSMCTHYAPLLQGDKFLLGKPDSEEYMASLPQEGSVNWDGVRRDLERIIPPLRWLR